jgi:hypothetical protein
MLTVGSSCFWFCQKALTKVMYVCCHADFEPTEHKLLNLG